MRRNTSAKLAVVERESGRAQEESNWPRSRNANVALRKRRHGGIVRTRAVNDRSQCTWRDESEWRQKANVPFHGCDRIALVLQGGGALAPMTILAGLPRAVPCQRCRGRSTPARGLALHACSRRPSRGRASITCSG
jgi:hypothetical protein